MSSPATRSGRPAAKVIGTIELPVILMHADAKGDGSSGYDCGYAHFTIQDCVSEVSDDDGRELGTAGATLGGNIFVQMAEGRHEHVLVSVRDVWDRVVAMLADPVIRARIDHACAEDGARRAEESAARAAAATAAAAERTAREIAEARDLLARLAAEEAALDE